MGVGPGVRPLQPLYWDAFLVGNLDSLMTWAWRQRRDGGELNHTT